MTKSAKKPNPSPPSRTITPIIVGKFSINGRTCEVFRLHGPSEGTIKTSEVIARGTIIAASMRKEDCDILFKHREEIPDEYFKNTFLFPMWDTDEKGNRNGYIRVMNRKDTTWWCIVKCGADLDWDSNCRIVRLSNLQLT